MPFTIQEKCFSIGGNRLTYGAVPWDSEIFGLPVIEITGAAVGDPATFDAFMGEYEARLQSEYAAHLRDGGMLMVCAKVPLGERDAIEGLQRNGYRFMEETITPYANDLRKIRPFTPPSDGTSIRRPSADDLPDLRRIASTTFRDDRFHADRRFAPGRAGARYAYWVTSSFEAGDDILCLEHGGRLAGFAILAFAGDRAHLSLIGVDDPSKGRGFGAQLLAAACGHAKDRGAKAFSTSVSLNNVGALNAYARQGLRFRDPIYVFHKWF